ncbi:MULTISPECIES: putative leader peptide [unclassified Frankia]|uniref:putative leader peptide n=1 Tax=Frankia TaxID=1854 RepID=UPI00351D1F71
MNSVDDRQHLPTSRTRRRTLTSIPRVPFGHTFVRPPRQIAGTAARTVLTARRHIDLLRVSSASCPGGDRHSR